MRTPIVLVAVLMMAQGLVSSAFRAVLGFRRPLEKTIIVSSQAAHRHHHHHHHHHDVYATTRRHSVSAKKNKGLKATQRSDGDTEPAIRPAVSPKPRRPRSSTGGSNAPSPSSTPALRRRRNQRRHKDKDGPPEEFPPFRMGLSPGRVRLVDTPELLDAAGETLRKSVVLAMDTETQPSYAVGEWHPTSLLQIGTRDADGNEDVILIDLLKLQDGLKLPQSLNEVLGGPFASPNILKLGVGLAEDLDDMAFAFEETPFLKNVPGILNLNVLHGRLVETPVRGSGIALRKLAGIYLGKSLSKRQQQSSWARRPLSGPQIEYAACDALVVLRLFDALVSAVGPLDLHQVTTDWTPKIYLENEMVPDKLKRLRRRRAARAAAVGQEHIRRYHDRPRKGRR